MSPDQPAITRLYRVCDPSQSIPPDDPCWVDFDVVRGDEKVIDTYVRGLTRADPRSPDFKLIAGHRGVGKTSELFRLQQALEKKNANGDGFIVIYCDVTEKLDLNDLDFPDLLVFLIAELQRQLPAAGLKGFSPTSQYLTKTWERLKTLLGTEVNLTSAEIDVGFAKISTELKNQPNARRDLRHAVESVSTSLLEAANDILVAARTAAEAAGKNGLVLIVDGLDKLARRQLEGGTNTHDRLFIERSEQLASLNVHCVYTVPISLIYSPNFGQLENRFGEHTPLISMIDVNKDNGIAALTEMVAKRAEYANLSLNDVCESPSVLQYLCKMSGGHPRHLLMFLQAACNEQDDLPLTQKSAEQAIKRYANSLSREISDQAWTLLRAFAARQDEMPKDDLHQEMLYLLHVYEYMNGAPWYQVNPVLRDLPRFNAS